MASVVCDILIVTAISTLTIIPTGVEVLVYKN